MNRMTQWTKLFKSIAMLNLLNWSISFIVSESRFHFSWNEYFFVLSFYYTYVYYDAVLFGVRLPFFFTTKIIATVFFAGTKARKHQELFTV